MRDIDNKVKLENGEQHCDKCKGSGNRSLDDLSTVTVRCRKCHGTGKFDWLELICGKKPELFGFHTNGNIGLGNVCPATVLHVHLSGVINASTSVS